MPRIKNQPLLVLVALVATAISNPHPAPAQLEVEQKASFELLADRSAYAPGDTVRLAAPVTLEHGWHMNANQPTFDWLIPTELRFDVPTGVTVGPIDYPPPKLMRFSFSDALSDDNAPIAVYEGELIILGELTLPSALEGESLTVPAILSYQACDDKSCLPPVKTEASIDLAIGEGGVPTNEDVFAAATEQAPPESSTPVSGGSTSLLLMLALGVVGGLILNAMPCVLPVLSLKVFGIVQSAEKGRRHLIAGSLATAAGILVSFLALAGAAVAARAAGSQVGWGVQFQQPAFVAFLTVIVILFALNMWGLFEIPLPAFLARAGGKGGDDGLSGHFASGLFATLMATPCSAPFLGTAVGFAFAQPAGTIFAIFMAIGVGLALPYLLLAVVPDLAKALPKPGDWMMTLRGVLGFFLAATAVWLFFVLAGQIGAARLALVQIMLLLMALSIWLYARARDIGRKVALAAALVAAVLTMVSATSGGNTYASGNRSASSHHEWLTFDEQEAETLAASGKLVFVDVTADWCLTCKTNEWGVLETDAVDEVFDRHEVVTMKADWTNRDDVIGAFLAKYGRSSIPFYVLYRPGQDPHVFGELLTKRTVVEAIEDSADAAGATVAASSGG